MSGSNPTPAHQASVELATERVKSRLAELYMVRERPDHTLQASALVNEAYLCLIDLNQMQWQNRGTSSPCRRV